MTHNLTCHRLASSVPLPLWRWLPRAYAKQSPYQDRLHANFTWNSGELVVDSRYHRLVPNHASIGQRVRSTPIDRTGCRPLAHFHVRWIRRSSEMMRLFVFGCNGMGFVASTKRFSTGVRQVNNLIGILHVAIRKRRIQSGSQPCAWGNLSTLCPCAVSDELHLGCTPHGAWRWLFSRHVSGVGHGVWASCSKSDRAHTGFCHQHVFSKAHSEL